MPCHLALGALAPRSGQGLLPPRTTGSISYPVPLQSLVCPFYKQTHILHVNRLYLHTYTSTHRRPTLWLGILGRRQELVFTEPASSQQMSWETALPSSAPSPPVEKGPHGLQAASSPLKPQVLSCGQPDRLKHSPLNDNVRGSQRGL